MDNLFPINVFSLPDTVEYRIDGPANFIEWCKKVQTEGQFITLRYHSGKYGETPILYTKHPRQLRAFPKTKTPDRVFLDGTTAAMMLARFNKYTNEDTRNWFLSRCGINPDDPTGTNNSQQ